MVYTITETSTQKILWVYTSDASLVCDLTVELMKAKNCDIAHVIQR